ncbi:MAG: hypothetical protein JW709_02075 [Sedimentisphaerales bacterium]|nr:hypothetical protein [Sedimentisphaerales bacterium]
MIKQLSKVGNSSALLLDKALMELVGLEEGGPVQITVQDGVLMVQPVSPAPVDEERFQKLLDKVVRERRSALRKLAQ